MTYIGLHMSLGSTKKSLKTENEIEIVDYLRLI